MTWPSRCFFLHLRWNESCFLRSAPSYPGALRKRSQVLDKAVSLVNEEDVQAEARARTLEAKRLLLASAWPASAPKPARSILQ